MSFINQMRRPIESSQAKYLSLTLWSYKKCQSQLFYRNNFVKLFRQEERRGFLAKKRGERPG